MGQISRRAFAALVGSGVAIGWAGRPAAFSQRASGASITAGDIIERIRQNVGVDWQDQTVDALKAGAASTRVTGVATTALATMAVLQQAVKAGANFVVTAEPTFFSRGDAPAPPAGRGRGAGPGASGGPPPPPPDPVFAAKVEFIERNNLAVFRLSDHWRARTPDPMVSGLAGALGWSIHQGAGDPRRVDVPPTTLEALVGHLQRTLQVRGGIRVVGDREVRVQRVGLLPGNTPLQAALEILPDVDVIVAGEVREWESVEYARDAIASGARKGLVLVGRVVSEAPGMGVCADWLRTFVPEVPVQHISVGDPYWRPA